MITRLRLRLELTLWVGRRLGLRLEALPRHIMGYGSGSPEVALVVILMSRSYEVGVVEKMPETPNGSFAGKP